MPPPPPGECIGEELVPGVMVQSNDLHTQVETSPVQVVSFAVYAQMKYFLHN